MKKKIVIIGAGLAGLSAALQTSENGNKVVLVSAYPSERAAVRPWQRVASMLP